MKHCSDEGLTLETSAFQIFHGGNSTFINSSDKTKFSLSENRPELLFQKTLKDLTQCSIKLFSIEVFVRSGVNLPHQPSPLGQSLRATGNERLASSPAQDGPGVKRGKVKSATSLEGPSGRRLSPVSVA